LTRRSGGGPNRYAPPRVAPRVDLPVELLDLSRFHGHLGVYVTVGLRMGQIGKRVFGDHKGLTANVVCRSRPPMLCIVDGVQFASGCTMGKGNIAVGEADDPVATFAKDGRELRIALRPGWRERIDREMSKELEREQSLFYLGLSEAELFDVSGPGLSTSSTRGSGSRTPGSGRTVAPRPPRPSTRAAPRGRPRAPRSRRGRAARRRR